MTIDCSVKISILGPQALQTEAFGKATDFQAVPGCGLKCTVMNIEFLVHNNLSDTEIMNRRNSTSSSTSFHVQVDTTAAGTTADSIPHGDIVADIMGEFMKLVAISSVCH